MAVDLWPYSGRLAGAVTDLEHEYLWSGAVDGVLPDQAGNACQVGISGPNWTVNPGRFRIAGHVLDLDVTQTGPLPEAGTATIRSVVVAYIDHSASPWTYGVQLVTGTPGGGRPALSTSRTGIYQVPLRGLDTATNGTTTLLADERIIITPEGGGLLRATNTVATQVPLLVVGAQGQSGPVMSLRKQDGYRLLDVSAVGRTGINTNGAPTSIGLHVKSAAISDVTMRLTRLAGQTQPFLQMVNESSSQLAGFDSAGNLSATNFDATNWATYTPTWDHTGTATFTSRTGRWKRIGQKTVLFRVFLKVGVAGAGVSSDVTFRLPTVPSRAMEHTFYGRSRNPGFHLQASALSSGTSNVVDEIAMVNSASTKNLTGDDLAAGMEISISGWYEEA